MSEPITELGHLNSLEASKLLKDNPEAQLIDIRTSMEFLFIGHPTESTHVAWMDDPDWEMNPEFLQRSTSNANVEYQ